jgi:diguanylate cyclase (GGDEF)-like protein/PAS domain S-box-containing protein
MPDGIVVVDAGGRIVLANRRLEQLTGYRRRELLGRGVELLVPSSLRAAHRRHRADYHARGAERRAMGRVDRDFRVRRKDGSEFSADIALSPLSSGSALQVVAVMRDITERKDLEAELEHRALHDPLTGLANRTLFFDRLRRAMLGSRRDARRMALVMMDLDCFKVVNDRYGHLVGDLVLRELGARLRSAVRATDTVARIGGDEFAWIVPRLAGRAAAARMVRKLERTIGTSLSVDGQRIEVSIAAGIALYPDDGAVADDLMRNADLALYSAKRSRHSLG